MSCEFDNRRISEEELIILCESLKQGDIKDKLSELQSIRAALTLQMVIPIAVVLKANIIPRLVEGANCKISKIELEVTWILCNIASGNEDQTREVMYSGVVPIFLTQLQNSNDKELLQMIIWCMGNICGDEKCRNILLSSRIVEIILGILNKFLLNQSIMENCVFCLRNALSFMDFSPAFRKQELKSLLNMLGRIQNTPSKQIEMHTGLISDILQLALSIIENNPYDIAKSVLPIINRSLSTMTVSVNASLNGEEEETNDYPTKSILETLGNICAENDMYSESLISYGILTMLHDVYFDPKNDDALCRLEVIFCWMNISGGSQSQILYNTGILQTLLDNVISLNENANEVAFEASRRSMVVICNFLAECSDDTKIYMLQNGIQHILEGYIQLVQNRWDDEDYSFVVEMLNRILGTN